MEQRIVSICSPIFTLLCKKCLNNPGDHLKPEGFSFVVPEKCSNYCTKRFPSNYMFIDTVLLEDKNITNHKVCKKLFHGSYCLILRNHELDICSGIRSSNVKNFSTFKHYIRYKMKDLIIDRDVRYYKNFDFYSNKSIFQGSFDAVLNDYVDDFKQYKFIHQIIYDNRFKIGDHGHALRLLSRRDDNVKWENSGDELKKCRKIKRLINLILSACITKNMSKLICYYV